MSKFLHANQLAQQWQGESKKVNHSTIYCCILFLSSTTFSRQPFDSIVDGQLTFDVNMSRGGDYAVNLSYLLPSEDDRSSLQVRVNNQEGTTFSLTTTGFDCNNGGSSTVVSLELKGFTNGWNQIHLETDGDNLPPYIEWVSVVTPLS